MILVNARKLSLQHPVDYEEVRNWSESFTRLMEHPVGRQLFKEYLLVEHSDENMQFWEAVEVYKNVKNPAELPDIANDIYEQFVSANSTTEVNLDTRCKAALKEQLKTAITIDLFEEAQQQCLKLMERDSYGRFTRSLLYRKFLQQQISLEVVRSWGEKFDLLMQHTAGRQLFAEFLQNEKADENLCFWEAVQLYKKLPDRSQQLTNEARRIYDDFVSSESKTEISIDSKIRNQINKEIDQPNTKIFQDAENHIYHLMARDPYHRFVRSNLYKKTLEDAAKMKNPVEEVE